MTSQTRFPIHVEKGQCYLGQSKGQPVDMDKSEFVGLRDVINRETPIDGNYEWDATSRELVTSGSAGSPAKL